jgi:hypothetical protein
VSCLEQNGPQVKVMIREACYWTYKASKPLAAFVVTTVSFFFLGLGIQEQAMSVTVCLRHEECMSLSTCLPPLPLGPLVGSRHLLGRSICLWMFATPLRTPFRALISFIVWGSGGSLPS